MFTHDLVFLENGYYMIMEGIHFEDLKLVQILAIR